MDYSASQTPQVGPTESLSGSSTIPVPPPPPPVHVHTVRSHTAIPQPPPPPPFSASSYSTFTASSFSAEPGVPQPVPVFSGVTTGTPTEPFAGAWAGGLRKVLVVLSSQSSLYLRNGKLQQTGTFLSELIRPLESILKAGFQPVFATPLGLETNMLPPPIDPMSDSFVWFGGSRTDYDSAKSLLERLASPSVGSYSRPRKLSSFLEPELQEFLGIFIPGGHAPFIDLYKDPDLGRILMHFHQHQKPTGAICHGPAGLLSAGITDLDDRHRGKPAFAMRIDWPYAGYHMTCYSDREESINELVWRDKVPFLLETTLRKSGAIVEVRSIPFLPNVIQYKELITGQGPTSASQFGSTFKDALIRFANSHITGSSSAPTTTTTTATTTPTAKTGGVAQGVGVHSPQQPYFYPSSWEGTTTTVPAGYNPNPNNPTPNLKSSRGVGEEQVPYQEVGSMATQVVSPRNR